MDMDEQKITFRVEERATLRKFRVVDDQQELYEVLTVVNGEVIDTWRQGEDRPPPEEHYGTDEHR